MFRFPLGLASMLLLLLVGCATPTDDAQGADAVTDDPALAADTPGLEWAIAIHGGAGAISKDRPEAEREAHYEALRTALEAGRAALAAGESSLDVVEKVVRLLEDAPEFNAGKGAVFTNDGEHELDAAIMDGSNRAAGAISGVTTVKNPITLARLVMTDTAHVFLIGDGAERFADEQGVERVEKDYFYVERRYQQWQRALAREAEEASGGDGEARAPAEKFGTVGCVALDRDGNLAAATSTGGMTNKRFGRVGDVPIIGAGTYADNGTAAVSGTGWGEKFIRNTVASDIAHRMAYKGVDLETAANEVIHGVLDEGDGGIIAVDAKGRLVLAFNSKGMFRGAADAGGRFEVGIWEGMIP